jgi:hypothetical protein
MIEDAITKTNDVFTLWEHISLFRASVAYLLRHIRVFVDATRPLRTRNLTTDEAQAIHKFSALIGQLSTLLPMLSGPPPATLLTLPSMHTLQSIGAYRALLEELTRLLSFDSDQLYSYDRSQNHSTRSPTFVR